MPRFYFIWSHVIPVALCLAACAAHLRHNRQKAISYAKWGLGAWLFLLSTPLVAHSFSYFSYADATSRVLELWTNTALWLITFCSVWHLLSRFWCTHYIIRCIAVFLKMLHRISYKKWCIAGALFVMLVAIALSYWWFSFTPFANDSIVQYVHAKILAFGHLKWKVPQIYEPIGWSLYKDGYWFSQFLPGHIALQSLGHVMHMPWLINPLLSALSVGLYTYIAQIMYTKNIARLVPVLYLASLYMMVVAASFMNHPTGLLGTGLCILGTYNAVQKNQWRWVVCAVFGMFMVATSRTANTFGLAAAIALWAGYYVIPNMRRYTKVILTACITLCISAAVILWYNDATMGHPFDFAYLHQQSAYIGRMSENVSHHPMGSIARVLSRYQDANIRLFEWPIPSFIFAAIYLLTTPLRKETVLLLLVFICSPIGYLTANDRLFMPRYSYEGTAGILILTAAGMLALIDFMKRYKAYRQVPTARLAAYITLMIVALFAASWQRHYNLRMQKYAFYYWEGYPAAVTLLDETVKKPAVIFVENDYRFLWAMPSYPPKKTDDIIFARWQQGSTLEKHYLELYPKRHIYFTNFMYTNKMRDPLNPDTNNKQQ